MKIVKSPLLAPPAQRQRMEAEGGERRSEEERCRGRERVKEKGDWKRKRERRTGNGDAKEGGTGKREGNVEGKGDREERG